MELREDLSIIEALKFAISFTYKNINFFLKIFMISFFINIGPIYLIRVFGKAISLNPIIAFPQILIPIISSSFFRQLIELLYFFLIFMYFAFLHNLIMKNYNEGRKLTLTNLLQTDFKLKSYLLYLLILWLPLIVSALLAYAARELPGAALFLFTPVAIFAYYFRLYWLNKYFLGLNFILDKCFGTFHAFRACDKLVYRYKMNLSLFWVIQILFGLLYYLLMFTLAILKIDLIALSLTSSFIQAFSYPISIISSILIYKQILEIKNKEIRNTSK